jgi:hypothetical protein
VKWNESWIVFNVSMVDIRAIGSSRQEKLMELSSTIHDFFLEQLILRALSSNNPDIKSTSRILDSETLRFSYISSQNSRYYNNSFTNKMASARHW